MTIQDQISTHWHQWSLAQRQEALAELYDVTWSNWKGQKDRIILPPSLIELFIQFLQTGDPQRPLEDKDLRFTILRILIYASPKEVGTFRNELTEICIQMLLANAAPVSDSANWLLNTLGPRSAHALLKSAQQAPHPAKGKLLGWLGRNRHISCSKEFEDEVFKEWLAGLSNPDSLVQRNALSALIDNSPPRVKSIRSVESTQDYEAIYPAIFQTLDAFRDSSDSMKKELAAFYDGILGK